MSAGDCSARQFAEEADEVGVERPRRRGQHARRLRPRGLLERIVESGNVKPRLPRERAADLRKQLQHAQPREFVHRVLDEPQVRDHVLDVRLLEEPQPAADLERDVPAPQFELDLDRVPMAAIEDGDVVELPLLVEQMEDVLGDELRLDAPVMARRHGRLQPGRPHGAQFLGQPARVVRDAGVRQGQDLRHGPVVRLEPVLPRVRIALLEPQDVLETRAAETVDGLRIVPDDADVPVRRRQRVHDRALDRVRVLVLVHQDVLELVGQNAAGHPDAASGE